MSSYCEVAWKRNSDGRTNERMDGQRQNNIPLPISSAGDNEDEFHFIMLCKNYTDIREKFIPKKMLQKTKHVQNH